MIDREHRLRQARFRVVKQLKSVDFKAAPSLDKMPVPDPARRENAVLLGPGGVGKTHVALAACHPVHEMIGVHDKKDCSAFRPGSPG